MDAVVSWSLPDPYWIEIVVEEPDIDRLGHANNASYLRWCERIGWAHSEALGLGWERWQELDRAMATHRARLSYRAPCFLGDRLLGATWVIKADGRLMATRRFEIRSAATGDLLFDAEIDYVCIDISRGKPRRMPAEFAAKFSVHPSVQQHASAGGVGERTAAQG